MSGERSCDLETSLGALQVRACLFSRILHVIYPSPGLWEASSPRGALELYRNICIAHKRNHTSCSDNREKWNSTPASLHLSSRLSNAIGTRWPGVFELKSFSESPSGCQRGSLFPHQQSTRGRLGKEEQISPAATGRQEREATWWWDYYR